MSFANSLRTLKAYLSSVTTQIGVGLAAAIRPAIVALNGLMKYILKAAQAFATFMKTLFPFKNGSKGMVVDATYMEDASNATADLADGAGDAASGLEDADEAAKKLKKDLSVLPFDELNQLNKDKTSTSKNSGSGSGGGIGGLGDLGLDEGLLDFDTKELEGKLGELESFVDEWAQRIKRAFNAKDWELLGKEIASGFNTGIQELYKILDPQKAAEKINPYIDAFTTTFNSFIKNLDWKTLGADIGRGVNILVSAANRILNPETGINWKNIGRELGKGANGLLSELDFKGIGELFANKFNVFWNVASAFTKTFNWGKLGDQLATGANALVSKIDWTSIRKTFSNSVNGLIGVVRRFLRKFDTEKFGEQLASTFKGIISDIKWGELGQALAEVWNKAWAFLATAIKGLGNSDGKGTGIGTAIITVLKSIVTDLKTDDMSSAIGGFVNKVAEDMIIVFGDTKTWSDLGSKIGTGLADTIKEIDEDKLSTAINNMVDALNALIGSAFDKLINDKEVRNKVIGFFRGIDWLGILKLAAPFIGMKLATGIGSLAFTKTKAAIITALGKLLQVIGGKLLTPFKLLFKNLPAAITLVFSKGGEVAKTLGSSVSSLFKEIGTSSSVITSGKNIFSSVIQAIGPGAAEGGVIAAVVEATKKLQEFNDAARGGNGRVSEEGGIFDSLINELETVYGRSKDDTQALFDLKESFENGELDEDTFVSKAGDELENMGISSDQAKNILGQLGDKVNITDRQMGLMEKTIKGLDTTTSQASKELELFGNKDVAIGKIGTALHNASMELMNGFGEEHLFAVKQDAIDTFTTMAKNGEDLKTALSNVITEFNLTDTEIQTLRKYIDQELGTGVFDALMTGTDTASTKVSGFMSAMANKTDTVTKAIGFLAEGAKKIPNEIATGVTHTQGMPSEIIEKMSGEMLAKMTRMSSGKSDFETSAQEIPKGAAQGIADAQWRAVGAVNTMANDMDKKFRDALRIKSPSGVFSDNAEQIPKGVAEGVGKKQSDAVKSITTLTDAISKEFASKLPTLKTTMYNGGKDVTSNLKSGIDANYTSYSTSVNKYYKVLSNLLTKFSNAQFLQNFYNAGQSIAQKLADGLNSVKVELPHIEWTGGYTRMYTGTDSWTDVPNYRVRWYRKGSLFTNPSVIGVGEAGTEGVIPLDNRKSMRMIADAIIDNSGGGIGLTKQDVVDAVVYAMAANAGNQPPVNVYATLYTEDNEVLARSVEKGQRSRDLRFNPSAAY